MIHLKVMDGFLCGVPEDTEGPLLIEFNQGKSWCATITGTAKKFERHFWERPRPRRQGLYYIVPAYARPGVVLEFGVNHIPEPPQPIQGESWEVTMQSAPEPKRRRWYGVIADLTPASLLLAPCADVANALAVAISYEAEPILPHLREQIARMVQNVKGGALMELGVLADMLDDLSDPRGKRIREAISGAVEGLFPECKPPEEKSGSLKLKASGSSETSSS